MLHIIQRITILECQRVNNEVMYVAYFFIIITFDDGDDCLHSLSSLVTVVVLVEVPVVGVCIGDGCVFSCRCESVLTGSVIGVE